MTASPWVRRTFAGGHFGENREAMKRFSFDLEETRERFAVPRPVLRGFKERIAGPAAQAARRTPAPPSRRVLTNISY